MNRRPLVAGNWKMHLGFAEAHELAWNCDQIAFDHQAVDVAIFPPMLFVGEIARLGQVDGVLRVGAQNCHAVPTGNFTGEVSAAQLATAGVQAVLVGHSERRIHAGETDAQIGAKIEAAVTTGLDVILCIGETLAERRDHQAEGVVLRQLAVLDSVTEPGTAIDVAYEPVWAIGTGESATPALAEAMCAAIRRELDRRGLEAGRVLYGGSVTPANAAELIAMPSIDGFLVGGASLDAASFLRIVEAVAAR